jgi:enolase
MRSRGQRAGGPGSTKIVLVHGREILDSRGNPTVEAEVTLANGIVGRAAVPSGASTGKHEAVELRDETKAYGGLGVMKAVANINVALAKALKGMDCRDQEAIDHAMLVLDGTPDKRRLGANALLPVSIAASRAAATAAGVMPFEYLAKLTGQKPLLPVPFANVINGGRHAAGRLKIQEFMIVPTGARTFSEATQMIAETYHALAALVEERYGAAATHVGDEGGFAPPLETPEEALELVMAAIKKAGHKEQMMLALDPAASAFYADRRYDLGQETLAPEQLVQYWKGLVTKYPVISLEDPFEQDDFLSWKIFLDDIKREKLRLQVVGDDLTVTNSARIQRAIDEGLCNALLLKVNQAGTLTEALQAATLAKAAGWNVMVSHRSGETEDPFIADLAVALGCGQIKLGAPCRSDRTAKYNQLLRIEERLGQGARYARFALPRT